MDLSTPALVTTAPLSVAAAAAAGRTCPGQLSAALAMAELSSVGIESVFHDESVANSRLKLTKAGSQDRMLSADATTSTTREFGTSTKPPKLGEIEQLSTETQTD